MKYRALFPTTRRTSFSPPAVVSMMIAVVVSCSLFAFTGLRQCSAQTPPPEEPDVAPASNEGLRTLDTIVRPDNWKVNLFAAEPDVANPVAFYVDYQNRMFVCETFRQARGVEDNRKHMDWLDDDLAAQSVADREAYIRKHLGEKAYEYTKHDDRIRLLRDEDHDGTVDKSTVFAKHFNTIVSGTGAGVLSWNDTVYYTCIPDLWKMNIGKDGDSAADLQSLHTGYGVRFAFRGHDSHGLIVGPDGRLYFSIGDRGANIKTDDGVLKNVASGIVFRCELDGSKLEMFATGLRNPQELAFDNQGNLFTGDNNSDSGDKARWVYVVEGGDTGWRMFYQYLDDRGPFNNEKIWHPYHEGQAAYIVPPIENISDGPSGLTFYPGTGLSDEYKDRFFLCDFRGQSSNSGVRSFRNKPRGAFFELVDSTKPIWSLLVTDFDFGPDGAMYVSDWVNGWEGLNKGRIYRLVDSDRDEAVVREVTEILAAGLVDEKSERLVALLGQADRRVRQLAQFELVRQNNLQSLFAAATDHDSPLARLHAIWGIAQHARTNNASPEGVTDLVRKLLADGDAEVRAQAVKMCGESKLTGLNAEVIARVSDENARVRYFATMSVAKLKLREGVDAVASMLVENNNADPILRHAGIMAIAGIGDAEIAHQLAHHDSPAVRLATTVALRKMQHPSIAHSLHDEDQLVVLEAARAIYDLPIKERMSDLADLISEPRSGDSPSTTPLMLRVLNANFRIGDRPHLENVLKFIAREDVDESLREKAVRMLNVWSEPSGRELVMGSWRPPTEAELAKRDEAMVKETVRANLQQLLAASDPIRFLAIRAVAELGIAEVGDELAKASANSDYDPKARADSILLLEKINFTGLKDVLPEFAKDRMPAVRNAARDVMTRLLPKQGLALLAQALDGSGSEQQSAFQTIRKMKDQSQDADAARTVSRLLVTGLEKMIAGKLDRAARLDLILAAESSKNEKVAGLLKQYEDSRPSAPAAAMHAESLYGGDSGLGAEIFYNRADVSCQRCHRVDGSGGKVGPDLSSIGLQKDRQYLLESIVEPDKAIAKGFETVIVDMVNGKTFSGILVTETEDSLTLIDAQARTKNVPKDDIDDRYTGASGMPADIVKQLSREDLRNVIEFLATRKSEPSEEEGHEE